MKKDDEIKTIFSNFYDFQKIPNELHFFTFLISCWKYLVKMEKYPVLFFPFSSFHSLFFSAFYFARPSHFGCWEKNIQPEINCQEIDYNKAAYGMTHRSSMLTKFPRHCSLKKN